MGTYADHSDKEVLDVNLNDCVGDYELHGLDSFEKLALMRCIDDLELGPSIRLSNQAFLPSTRI